MSAYQVSDNHLRAIVRGMQVYGRDMWGGPPFNPVEVSSILQLLWLENARSVAYRYEEAQPTGDDIPEIEPPRGLAVRSGVELLKLVNCYTYQSCEHPGWRGSEAWELAEGLQGAIIKSLPGYAEAPWELA